MLDDDFPDMATIMKQKTEGILPATTSLGKYDECKVLEDPATTLARRYDL